MKPKLIKEDYAKKKKDKQNYRLKNTVRKKILTKKINKMNPFLKIVDCFNASELLCSFCCHL